LKEKSERGSTTVLFSSRGEFFFCKRNILNSFAIHFFFSPTSSSFFFMAKSHSRFTDEVFCTPAPSAPTIPVKPKDELMNEIFIRGRFQDFRHGLQAAEQLNSRELYVNYPPNFKDKNKQFIVRLLDEPNKYMPLPDKSILITRWKPFNPIVEQTRTATKVLFNADTFDYKPYQDDTYVEWYVNFANSDLFAYYAGQLLAQDELQVLECVELASLREYLALSINSVGTQTIGNEAQTGRAVPTPSKSSPLNSLASNVSLSL
jgi:hypothetical protein